MAKTISLPIRSLHSPICRQFDKTHNSRDDLFYNEQTGMLHVAEKIKANLASVCEYGSQEMKYINALKFTYPKKK